MRQNIYREEKPYQESKDPCSFITDLFLWGMQHLNQDPAQSSDVPCKATIPPSSSQDDFDEEGDTSFTEVSESVVEKLLVADNTAASNSSTTEEAMD